MLKVSDLACMRGEGCLFSGLSFELREGQVMHLVGSNGIGKSSLLRLLAGFSNPLSGDIEWQGENIHQDLTRYRQDLVFLPDQAPLKKQLCPDDHLNFWQRLLGFKDGVSGDVGLGKVSDLPTKMLSSGQRRRSSFLLLTGTRKLWLLDEPFVGLDSQGVEMLLEKIEQHRQDGGIIILTSHIALDMPNCTVLSLTEFTLTQFVVS